MTHTCHWPGCTKAVAPKLWGCAKHWFRLPKFIRDEIWRTYRPGQEITKTPSAAYLDIAHEAQRWARALDARKPGEESYRPCNGTEGGDFIDMQCGDCARSGHHGQPDDTGEELIGCSITGETFLFDIDDPRYPPEWVESETDVRCTAFVRFGEPVPPPADVHTADLFSAVT